MEQEAPLEPGESETPRSEASYTSEAPLSPTVPEGMEEDSNLEQKAGASPMEASRPFLDRVEVLRWLCPAWIVEIVPLHPKPPPPSPL